MGSRETWKDKVLQWVVDKLPLGILYRATVRAWAIASTGMFSAKEAGAITVFDTLQALTVEQRK